MNCTFCQAPLTPGAQYCSKCGTVVPGPADPGVYDAAYDHPSAAPPPAMPAGPYYGAMPPTTSTLAIVSLISGIASWLGIFGLGAIIAVIIGHMARREIRESGGRIGGDSMTVFGLVLGYVQIALIAVLLLVVVALVIFGVGFAALG